MAKSRCNLTISSFVTRRRRHSLQKILIKYTEKLMNLIFDTLEMQLYGCCCAPCALASSACCASSVVKCKFATRDSLFALSLFFRRHRMTNTMLAKGQTRRHPSNNTRSHKNVDAVVDFTGKIDFLRGLTQNIRGS